VGGLRWGGGGREGEGDCVTLYGAGVQGSQVGDIVSVFRLKWRDSAGLGG